MEAIDSDPKIDAAIVDVNLGGALAYPVADALLARKYHSSLLPAMKTTFFSTRYPQIKNCLKPYLFLNMEEALTSAISGADRRSHGVPAE